MIDFTKLTGIEHDGKVVTQIEDSAGRVLWVVQSNEPIVLEVEKVISNTYAGETTYENEEFILLDIYPKTNGTVSVTYGGLTKTITDTSGADEPNAQRVFFGTFNGVTDEVATPTSGTLTIEGEYYAFGCGSHTQSKTLSVVCSCITSIVEWGNVTFIPIKAFKECAKLSISAVPEGVTKIEKEAFYSISGDKMYYSDIILPSSLKEMYLGAFGTAPIMTSEDYAMQARRIIMLATTPPTMSDSDYIISAYDGFGIIVPKGCSNAYKSAEGWKKFQSYIVEAT